MKKMLRRELEVAFSKHAQPLWFRTTKWMVLLALLYCFRGTPGLGWKIGIVLILAVGLHLFYRYKTKGWTRSYGGWDYEKNKPKSG